MEVVVVSLFTCIVLGISYVFLFGKSVKAKNKRKQKNVCEFVILFNKKLIIWKKWNWPEAEVMRIAILSL